MEMSVNKHIYIYIHAYTHLCVCAKVPTSPFSTGARCRPSTISQAFNLPLRSTLSCDLRRFHCGTSYGKVWSLSAHAYALRYIFPLPAMLSQNSMNAIIATEEQCHEKGLYKLGFPSHQVPCHDLERDKHFQAKRQASWAESFTLDILLGTTSCSQETRATNLTGSRWRGAYSQSVMCLECVSPYSYEYVQNRIQGLQ